MLIIRYNVLLWNYRIARGAQQGTVSEKLAKVATGQNKCYEPWDVHSPQGKQSFCCGGAQRKLCDLSLVAGKRREWESNRKHVMYACGLNRA